MATIRYEDILEKDILELLNLTELPEKDKQAIYHKLYETIENQAMLRVDKLIPDVDFVAWKKLLQDGDRAEADTFLTERGIDIQRILIEESALLKAQLVFSCSDDAVEGGTVVPAGAH